MDFLKRVTEGLTHAEERNAIAKAKEAEQVHQVQIEKSEVEVIPALISVTPDQVTALTGEAEITTLQSATVDMVARAPVIDETIILEQKESMLIFFNFLNLALLCLYRNITAR